MNPAEHERIIPASVLFDESTNASTISPIPRKTAIASIQSAFIIPAY